MRSVRSLEAGEGRRRLPLVLLLLLQACSSPAPPVIGDGAGADLPLDASGPELREGSAELPPAPDLLRGPPYPIILAHGFFGFDKIGPIDYFWKVKPALVAAGHEVFITTVDPFNGYQVRGEQLLGQTRQLLEQTGSARINIIAHSQGGMDARYVASQIPHRIGAVITIGTPHLGTKVADVVLDRAPGFSLALLQAVCALAGRPFWGDIAKDPSLKACLESLSTAGSSAFNDAHPDAKGVSYFSIAGRSNLQLAESECAAPMAPPFITRYRRERDPTDPMLTLTGSLLGGNPFSFKPNDGLVHVSSTKWGTWLGCIPADHFDEMGQLFGDHPGIGNDFDHLQFYKDLAAFLVARGF